ncbi:MAG: hypothetical protein RH982_05100 [Parvibaculum sp.]
MKLKQLAGDAALLLATRLVARFFGESVDTPPFDEHLAAIRMQLPKVDATGLHDVSVTSLAGTHSSSFHVLHWRGAEAPVLIWHQGGGERPFDLTIGRMYPAKVHCDFNVIAIQTPLQNSLREANTYFAHLHNYVAMMATVVRMAELFLTETPLAASRCKMMGGYSLGGIVSNRHRVEYGSADLYFPFMAGTCHGDIFAKSVRMGPAGRKNLAAVRDRLNFDRQWAEAAPANVFPVLGKTDMLNRLGIQGPSYEPTPYEVWDGGHLYGAARPHLLRKKIEAHFLASIAAR